MKSTPTQLFLWTFVIVLVFSVSQSTVKSKYVFNNIEYEKASGQLAKRTSSKQKPITKCQCTQAIAEFGEDAKDTSCMVGSVQFIQNPCGQTTIVGTFQSGFRDTQAKYEFKLVGNQADDNRGHNHTIHDITKLIHLKFFNKGLKTFQATTADISLNCNGKGAAPNILNTRLFVYVNGDRAGSSTVRRRNSRRR